MTKEDRARWHAGLEARARENAEEQGIAYEVALAEEIVNRHKRMVAVLEAHQAFIMAIIAIPDYLVSAEEKIEQIQKMDGFLPDDLLDYIKDVREEWPEARL